MNKKNEMLDKIMEEKNKMYDRKMQQYSSHSEAQDRERIILERIKKEELKQTQREEIKLKKLKQKIHNTMEKNSSKSLYSILSSLQIIQKIKLRISYIIFDIAISLLPAEYKNKIKKDLIVSLYCYKNNVNRNEIEHTVDVMYNIQQ